MLHEGRVCRVLTWLQVVGPMITYSPTEEEVTMLQDWKAANPDTAPGDDKYAYALLRY